MRPHRRRGPLEHVLVAGDPQDLAAIQALLALLPTNVYGQVYVEAPADVTLPSLNAPARVTVTRLDRGPETPTGDSLSAAVQHWLAEWIPDEPEPDRVFTLWVGRSARHKVDPAGATLESL